jgi:hypothetical protein
MEHPCEKHGGFAAARTVDIQRVRIAASRAARANTHTGEYDPDYHSDVAGPGRGDAQPVEKLN